MVIATNTQPQAATKSTSTAHPLDPLTVAEIKGSVAAVRKYCADGKAEGNPKEVLFNSIALLEPPKYDVLRWAGTFTPKEITASTGAKLQPIKRQADVSSLTWEPVTATR